MKEFATYREATAHFGILNYPQRVKIGGEAGTLFPFGKFSRDKDLVPMISAIRSNPTAVFKE